MPVCLYAISGHDQQGSSPFFFSVSNSANAMGYLDSNLISLIGENPAKAMGFLH